MTIDISATNYQSEAKYMLPDEKSIFVSQKIMNNPDTPVYILMPNYDLDAGSTPAISNAKIKSPPVGDFILCMEVMERANCFARVGS